MKDQVLTIEQMNILISKGVDVSKASMFYLTNMNHGWIDLVSRQYMERYDCVISGHEYQATFDVADLMEILPEEIESLNQAVYEISIVRANSLWEVHYQRDLHSGGIENLIMTIGADLVAELYGMVVRLLDNNHKLNNQT